MKIDLNSDLGEHYGSWQMGDDNAILDIVTSANVACGFHAGDPHSMLATVRAAAVKGVSVGAHVSYPDLVGFGRRPMEVNHDDLMTDVIYQIGALQGIAKAVGTRVSYVKPHGALYNRIARDEEQAAAVIDAMLAINPELPLVALAGAPIIAQAQSAGLQTVAEAFADRAYETDGSLMSRQKPGSVLHDPDTVGARMVRLAREGVVESADGTLVEIPVDSICVHGDSAGAVAMAQAVRVQLVKAGVELSSFTGA